MAPKQQHCDSGQSENKRKTRCAQLQVSVMPAPHPGMVKSRSMELFDDSPGAKIVGAYGGGGGGGVGVGVGTNGNE
eukprot:CAMPEP_0113578182 /NCGR_PEP_ID=MMETSP0015_2-20120614/29323_1 /TAXON_ID=2838 /ORGANISM="Odontella" /LENGTH=75 /DNA_ID=CAMNT_0000481927 /DNA_START=200 /DNA_END=424 /DNA_ORIENTATION=- /assembly_acc=CAM_ASM_000160